MCANNIIIIYMYGTHSFERSIRLVMSHTCTEEEEEEEMKVGLLCKLDVVFIYWLRKMNYVKLYSPGLVGI